MKKFVRENSLTIVLFSLFLVFLVGLSIAGYLFENEELTMHAQPAITYSQYLVSSSFIEAVFENWESEFLQMGALVVLTIWLVQKGSADSKKLRGKGSVDTSSRYSIIHARSWRTRKKAIGMALYANSLSLALFGLFIMSFILHAYSGAAAASQDALLHGQVQISVAQYVTSSQFWFESLQNWQSEFLAVGALIVLSVYLRQRKSPESKPVGKPNSATGS
jgi:hypothetical protein